MKAIIFNGSNAEDVIKHTGASFKTLNGRLQVFVGAEWKTVKPGDVVATTSWSVDIMTPAQAKEIGFSLLEGAESNPAEEPVQVPMEESFDSPVEDVHVEEPHTEEAPEQPSI